jgi:hypothetical protein
MANRIEALPLRKQRSRIELRVQDPFFVVQRPRKVRAVGREDRAAAPTEHAGAVELSAQRKVGRVRGRVLDRTR